MARVTPQVAQETLPALLDRVAAGESFEIVRDGAAIAVLSQAVAAAGAAIRDLDASIQAHRRRISANFSLADILSGRDEGRRV